MVEPTNPNIIINTYDDVKNALSDFYAHYIVDTVNGSFQIFQSFTYGEMTISILLFSIILLMVFRWLYEVIR